MKRYGRSVGRSVGRQVAFHYSSSRAKSQDEVPSSDARPRQVLPPTRRPGDQPAQPPPTARRALYKFYTLNGPSSKPVSFYLLRAHFDCVFLFWLAHCCTSSTIRTARHFGALAFITIHERESLLEWNDFNRNKQSKNVKSSKKKTKSELEKKKDAVR